MNRPILFSASLVALLASTGALAEDEKRACAAAAEHFQQLRDEGKYAKAREQLLFCSRDVCPPFVKKDCVDGLATLEASQPSLVLGARDAKGHDVSAVRVFSDGAPIATSLDGKAIRIDPGPHKLRFEMEGAKPVEHAVVVREGEKNRVVTIDFGGGAAAAPAPRPVVAPPPADQPRSSLPTGAFVLGGFGIAALGAFGVLAGVGTSELSNLHATCGTTHTCDPSMVDATRTKLIAADVSLATGVVSLGIATTWLLLSRGKPAPATGLDVRVGPSAVLPTWRATF